MSTKIGTILADFTTSLATALAIGGTSVTLSSATDDDGVALPSGQYYFTLDGGNTNKEHIQAQLSGTSLTSIYSVSRQGVLAAGVVRAHRIGTTVSLTDFANLRFLGDLLTGSTTLNASTPLGYDGTAIISTANQLATKAYVDGVAIAGSPDSSTTVKGIGRVSVAPASAAIPIFVGDNDPRVPTQGENDALVGNNTDVAVGSSNKFVTQTGLQHNAEKYVAVISASSTAYVATLSPAPTSQTDGMVVYLKMDVANTTTTPTLALNGLTARTIVKGNNTALRVADIAAGMRCAFMYDLANTKWVLLNPVATVPVGAFATGNTTHDNTATTTNTIAHGLGVIPKYVRITVNMNVASASNAAISQVASSVGTYDGTTQNSLYVAVDTNGNFFSSGVDTTKAIHISLGASGSANAQYLTGTVTFDATNITITWAKTGTTSAGTNNIIWEAFA